MARAADFKFVARVRPDSKGRITLGRLGRGVSSYQLGVDSEGRVLLEPYVEIPAPEQWLYENADAYASVRAGLEQSAKGVASYLGSFAPKKASGKRGT
jgi:hypothetical protein